MAFELENLAPVLVGILESTPTRSQRDHGKNVDIIKSFRDGEAASLTAVFTFVSGLFASLLLTGGAFLYTNMTARSETGHISVVDQGTTTVTKTLSSQGLNVWNIWLLGALIFLLVATLTFTVANRLRASRLERAYSNGVELYYELEKWVP